FRCALNYSKLGEADSLLVWGKLLKLLNQEYAARIRGKLIQKLLLNQKCHTPPRRNHEVKLHGYRYNTMVSTIEILKGKVNN
ncbi:hypothetical protein Tco_1171274, partial [Tanacetum coccineum]